MTKFQKQMLTIAAAGALTAVTALPAMAFENEFHGMFQIRTYLSNFDNAGASVASQVNPSADHKTNNFTDQRTRLQYTAKASDDLKLVTQFEFNTTWGNQTIGKGGGGGIDTDSTNLVVKHAYLDFNVGKSLNVKLGQQAYKDNLKGLYVDADLPMARATYKTGGYTLDLGYSRFNDATVGGSIEYKGDAAADLYVVDNSFAFSKDTKAGLVYYLNADNADATTSKKVNTLGLYGQTKLGALDLSGFAAMQAGYMHALGGSGLYHGWAADVLAKMKVGSGTAKAGFLFTSGNNSDSSNHGWQTLSSGMTSGTAASAAQNTYNDAGMMILVRDLSTTGSTTANYMRVPITNIALLHMGYDAALTDKLNLIGNVGMAWVPASAYLNGATASTSTHSVNGADYMGTELNLTGAYKLYKNLTLKAEAGYVILGSAYKGLAGTNAAPKDFANPFTTRLGAFYSF
jgi:hypothetical protein